MANQYSDYLSMPLCMPFEEMERLHSEIMAEVGSDPDALELYDEFVAASARYASFRSNWRLWDAQTKLDRDSARTSAHDAAIIKVDQLARHLRKQGKEAGWRDRLGDAEDGPYVRKRIGDFACYVAFVSALCAR